MQEVGYHLQLHAHTLPSAYRDAFARSAYNRYYYACFLFLRSELEQMNSTWRSRNHKDYPNILRNSVNKVLTNEQKKARRRNDYDLVYKITRAKHASIEIAELMNKAYAVRVIADYEPQVGVTFENTDRFSLSDIDITTAHNWQPKVRTLMGPLKIAWSQINA